MPKQRRQDLLLAKIRNGEPLTLKQQIVLTAALSLPAMLAQFSFILMEFIDASMVGHLGKEATGAIGLVGSTTWIFGGLCNALATGFSVQVAHLVGANNMTGARSVLRQSLVTAVAFSLLLMSIGVGISWQLPYWIGGSAEIIDDASAYFRIFCLTLPLFQLQTLGSGMLRCSGDMLVPSVLGILFCLFDVVFNYVFIYSLDMGVRGAAWGSAMAAVVVTLLTLYFLCLRSETMRLTHECGSFRPRFNTLRRAAELGFPMALERIITCGAQITSTRIVAPLGTAAIAANTLGITVESICYMPGFGISDAATTLVGQSRGAERYDLMHRFANICVFSGILIMTIMGGIMYFGAYDMMSLLTPVEQVRQLGTSALRIEAFAEPMYAAQIVCYGVFVGAGDTMIPAGMNLISIWAVRIVLALILTPIYGLNGAWLAMAIELTFRGFIFLMRYKWGHWDQRREAKERTV